MSMVYWEFDTVTYLRGTSLTAQKGDTVSSTIL